MDQSVVRALSAGVNQSGVRNHNERLLLTILQRHGPLPGTDLARIAGLSPQTVSVILRKLENDGLLERGSPVRGKVGKPSVPMGLAADGVMSLGLKIGRRSADLLLIDFHGTIRQQLQITYAYPLPRTVFMFLADGIAKFRAKMRPELFDRLCGIGVAAPFEIWHWAELVGAPAEEFQRWSNIDIAAEVASCTDLPVSLVNDATAGCWAEHVYGRGKEFRDYAYFFVGAFVGGGIVLNNSVYEGQQGNAGALGSLRSIGPQGESLQLIDTASIHLLETMLTKEGRPVADLWVQPQDWTAFTALVDAWIAQTALELAKASLSTCAVIDFEAIVIDGAFPADVRTKLVAQIRMEVDRQDTRGLKVPRIEEGTVGGNARAIGAASGPIFQHFLLNTNTGVLA